MQKSITENGKTGFHDKQILESWQKNVSPWVDAIQHKQIESRVLVTDKAIIETVISLSGNNAPDNNASGKSVLDIGCGEGWLTRALITSGLSVTGIDAVQGLVDKAKALGEGDFHVLEYEQFSDRTIPQQYDIAVCNFSLIGNESVEHLFSVLPSILNKGGTFIIQTLNPYISCGDAPYVDGWREGSWNGFSHDFCDPAPWYFRTIASWLQLFINNGFVLKAFKEPIDSSTGKPASLILVGKVVSSPVDG